MSRVYVITGASSGFGRACVPELLVRADIEAGRVEAVGDPRDGRARRAGRSGLSRPDEAAAHLRLLSSEGGGV